MKRLLLGILMGLTGCTLLPQAYYRGQPVELNPLYHEETCYDRQELPIVTDQNLPGKESISSPPAIQRMEGKQQIKCTKKIRINGQEQEVDSKEIVWRWI